MVDKPDSKTVVSLQGRGSDFAANQRFQVEDNRCS